MELIDRYIYAVVKRLPQKQRDDIEKELRSLIDDMLGERCGGNPPNKEDIEAVLRELGDPALLASKYREGRNYLIGPEYFDTYLLVLKIVVAAVAFGVGLGKTIEMIFNPPAGVAESIAELLAAVISGAFQGFTFVTVIFALNERYSFYQKAGLKKDDWKVSDLPAVPKKEELIKPLESIAGIIFSGIFLILFCFISQLIGMYIVENQTVTIIPIFSAQGLRAFLPWIIALYGLTILKECAKLIIGRWNLTLGVLTTVLNMAALAVCVVIFANPAVWNGNFVADMTAAGLYPQGTDFSLSDIWSAVTKGFIYFIAAGLIIDSVVSLIKGFRYGR